MGKGVASVAAVGPYPSQPRHYYRCPWGFLNRKSPMDTRGSMFSENVWSARFTCCLKEFLSQKYKESELYAPGNCYVLYFDFSWIMLQSHSLLLPTCMSMLILGSQQSGHKAERKAKGLFCIISKHLSTARVHGINSVSLLSMKAGYTYLLKPKTIGGGEKTSLKSPRVVFESYM